MGRGRRGKLGKQNQWSMECVCVHVKGRSVHGVGDNGKFGVARV